MSVYSNTEIKEAVKNGTIVSVPYNEQHVSEASLDFTLGYYFYKQENREDSRMYNPFDKSDVDRYFKGPLKAMPHHEWCDKHGYKPFKNIPRNHPIIILRPGERILAHTHEFIGIRAHGGAAEVRARSSWGRNGVAVCFDAGWVDPGFSGVLTFEFVNVCQYHAIRIRPGDPVGQLVWHRHAAIDYDNSYRANGRYSGRDSVAQTCKRAGE